MRRPSSMILLAGFSFIAIGGHVFAAQPIPVPVTYKVTLSGPYITFGDADIRPKPIHIQNAIYPPDFHAAGIGGFALAEFIVDTTGTPTQVQIVRATDVEFAKAALEALRYWTFSVAMKNGVPVPCAEQIPLVFNPKH